MREQVSLGTRIAFLGTPEAAVPVLRALAGAHSLQAVFCNPDRPVGRGQKLEAPPVKKAALDQGLPVHQPTSWKDPATRELWEALAIDLAVVVAYGHILPAWMLDSCRLGAWNLHFSLLPKWRGASPVNHAILAGDEETGVSLMRLEKGLDSGPVLAQNRRSITDQDYAESLLSILSQDATELLLRYLSKLLDGTAEPLSQDESRVSFAPKLSRELSRLDPGRAATHLHRQVRALQPWPGTDLEVEGTILKVCGVGALEPSQNPPGTFCWDRHGAWLSCGDGQRLALTLLQRPGKPVQTALQALQPWGAAGKLLLPKTKGQET